MRESCKYGSVRGAGSNPRPYRNRREFIAGLGSAAAWPMAVRAQQRDRMRRIGVLMPFDENEPVVKSRISAFIQALADLGWTDGRDVRVGLWGAGFDTNRIRALAQELVGLQPDIIVTARPATFALQSVPVSEDRHSTHISSGHLNLLLG
jgi:hypothetical protein